MHDGSIDGSESHRYTGSEHGGWPELPLLRRSGLHGPKRHCNASTCGAQLGQPFSAGPHFVYKTMVC